MMYCYSIFDSEKRIFSPVQTYLSDDIAVYEILSQFCERSLKCKELTPDLDYAVLNPYTKDKYGVRYPNVDFLARFEIVRLGIFDEQTGLIDCSVEPVCLGEKMQEIICKEVDYFNNLYKKRG